MILQLINISNVIFVCGQQLKWQNTKVCWIRFYLKPGLLIRCWVWDLLVVMPCHVMCLFDNLPYISMVFILIQNISIYPENSANVNQFDSVCTLYGDVFFSLFVLIFYISALCRALFLANVIIHSIVYTIVSLVRFSYHFRIFLSLSFHPLSIDWIHFVPFRFVSRRTEIIIQHIERKQKAWKMNDWLPLQAATFDSAHTRWREIYYTALFRINYIIFWKIVSHWAFIMMIAWR